MVAITVALDSRLAERGAQQFGRALADVNRVVGSTLAGIDRLNNGMMRGADAFTRTTAAVASTAGETRDLGRVIQAGGVAGLLNAGSGGGPLGSGGPALADPLLTTAHFSRRRRGNPLETISRVLDAIESAVSLYEWIERFRAQRAQQEMNEARSALEDEIAQIAGEIETEVFRLQPAPHWGDLIIDDVRSNVFQLRNTEFNEQDLLQAFPDAESIASYIASARQRLDNRINRATFNLFSSDPYNIEPPPNDALYPESWFAHDPDDIPFFLSPHFQRPPLANQLHPQPRTELGPQQDQDPPPLPPGPFDRLGMFFGGLAPLGEMMRAEGLDFGDISGEAFRPPEPIRVPLDLFVDDVEGLSRIQNLVDDHIEALQSRFDQALPQLAESLLDDDIDGISRAERYLQAWTETQSIFLRQALTPIPSLDGDLPDLRDRSRRLEIAESVLDEWMRAYFEALVDNTGGSERQGAGADGTDLGFRDVEQSILDGQLASSMVTADMLPVGGLAAVVPTPEEIELLMARSEALRAQSGALDEGYTPATKGAAEATMELADAAVGLDAALKAPDPAAMAEDMEALSALGQQVGNSFASAFERAIFSGEELSDVLSALALDLARLVLQQQVLAPLAGGIGGLFDSIFGGLFGITAAGAGGSVGGVTQGAVTGHRGGIAGSLPSYARGFSPGVFIGASRYHFGGLAGDEVPAILRRGEEVLTRDDPRHRANGGLGGGMAGGDVVTVNTHLVIEGGAVNNNGLGPEAEAAVGRQIDRAVGAAVDRRIARQMRVGGMLNRVA